MQPSARATVAWEELGGRELSSPARFPPRGFSQVYSRQTLVGGNYALLDSSRDFEPNPDYYALMLWRQLMGARVLLVSPDTAHPKLRVCVSHPNPTLTPTQARTENA